MVDYCKDLLNEFATPKDFKMKGFVNTKQEKEAEKMIKMSVKLLYALLEANTNKQMLDYLAFNIDFDYLIQMLTKEYKSMFEHTKLSEKSLATLPVDNLNKYLKVAIFSEEILEAFDIYFLIRTLDDHNGTYRDKISGLAGIQKNAFKMFAFHSGVI